MHTLWTADGTVQVASAVEVAADPASRNRGLLGRQTLAAGAALVLVPCWTVHTFAMHFPIDLIYAARDGRIVKLVGGLRPWRMSAAVGAFATIEMPAGSIERARLATGMRLAVQ